MSLRTCVLYNQDLCKVKPSLYRKEATKDELGISALNSKNDGL